MKRCVLDKDGKEINVMSTLQHDDGQMYVVTSIGEYATFCGTRLTVGLAPPDGSLTSTRTLGVTAVDGVLQKYRVISQSTTVTTSVSDTNTAEAIAQTELDLDACKASSAIFREALISSNILTASGSSSKVTGSKSGSSGAVNIGKRPKSTTDDSSCIASLATALISSLLNITKVAASNVWGSYSNVILTKEAAVLAGNRGVTR